jgi:glutathione S-transferase
MAELTLYIGNKAYSSWSLRAWLALKHVGTPFKEVVVPLEGPRIRTVTGKVPALRYGDLVVWDSLAIGEYLAEEFQQAHLWPTDRIARATARSVSAEMHSGFPNLRSALPMNVRRRPIEITRSIDVEHEIARVVSLWGDCRRRFGGAGPFLFGRFSVADAMYAPVATRFRTYCVPLDEAATAYVDAIHDLPSMKQWIADAKKELWTIEAYERVGG